MLEWEIEHLQKCCQDLEREKAHVEGQLQQEKHKWFPRFLNAIGAKTNTPCEACRYQCSEVYLTQCFHLLCRECYPNQGPETPNAVANWTCKACAPFHFLYRYLYAIDQFSQHPESASYEYPFIAYPSYIEIWRLLRWLPKRSIQYITHNHHT